MPDHTWNLDLFVDRKCALRKRYTLKAVYTLSVVLHNWTEVLAVLSARLTSMEWPLGVDTPCLGTRDTYMVPAEWAAGWCSFRGALRDIMWPLWQSAWRLNWLKPLSSSAPPNRTMLKSTITLEHSYTSKSSLVLAIRRPRVYWDWTRAI